MRILFFGFLLVITVLPDYQPRCAEGALGALIPQSALVRCAEKGSTPTSNRLRINYAVSMTRSMEYISSLYPP